MLPIRSASSGVLAQCRRARQCMYTQTEYRYRKDCMYSGYSEHNFCHASPELGLGAWGNLGSGLYSLPTIGSRASMSISVCFSTMATASCIVSAGLSSTFDVFKYA